MTKYKGKKSRYWWRSVARNTKSSRFGPV